jgi:DNA-binding transcriptional LysR family regulator
MTTHGMATFLAIHRAGSISGACEQLHLSQPAVSRRLQNLERELGAPLFERTRSGLRLTSAGEVLLPHAERAHAAGLDAVRAVADHLQGTSGVVRLGIVGSLAGPWFVAALEAARAIDPDLDLVVSTTTSRGVREQVQRGDVAVGVGYLQPQDPDLDVMVLFDEVLVVVCRPDHTLAGRRVGSFDELHDERWLLFPDQPDHPESASSIARRMLERHQVPDQAMRSIDSLSAQVALVQAGYGLAFVPTSVVTGELERGSLAMIQVSGPPIAAPVTLMTRAGAYLSPAARAVVDRLTLLGAAEHGTERQHR